MEGRADSAEVAERSGGREAMEEEAGLVDARCGESEDGQVASTGEERRDRQLIRGPCRVGADVIAVGGEAAG
jgi:hypothetical protein